MHYTDECWLGIHPNCTIPEYCDCACHATFTDLDLEEEL